jgi:hypothetical protein
MNDKSATQEGHGYEGNTWLGQNLPRFEALTGTLQILDTQRDAIPSEFNPKEFLQFLRGMMNEIKSLTAQKFALTNALKAVNKGNKSDVINEDTTINFSLPNALNSENTPK